MVKVNEKLWFVCFPHILSTWPAAAQLAGAAQFARSYWHPVFSALAHAGLLTRNRSSAKAPHHENMHIHNCGADTLPLSRYYTPLHAQEFRQNHQLLRPGGRDSECHAPSWSRHGKLATDRVHSASSPASGSQAGRPLQRQVRIPLTASPILSDAARIRVTPILPSFGFIASSSSSTRVRGSRSMCFAVMDANR
jgi:hypothetical protein